MTARKTGVTNRKRCTDEQIGFIAVDSGMIWISDPCQVFGPGSLISKESQPLCRDYVEFLHKTGFTYDEQIEWLQRVHKVSRLGLTAEALEVKLADLTCRIAKGEEPTTEISNGVTCFSFELGHPGAGIAISTPHGDGLFPVFVKRSATTGEIVELRIRFSRTVTA